MANYRAFCANSRRIKNRRLLEENGLGSCRRNPFHVADYKKKCRSREVLVKHDNITDIATYLRLNATELGERILSSYPALHSPQEKPSPFLSQLIRRPYPAQSLAIMGVMRRWQLARNANVVAECGAGKTLIALGSMLVHSAGRPFSALVMAPPHLVVKWARETFLTLPQVRVFLIEDMRNGGNPENLTASMRCGCGAARSCAKECTPRLPSCGALGGTAGGGSAQGPRSSALGVRKPSSPISGSTATAKAVLEGTLGRSPTRTPDVLSRQMGCG